MKISCNLKEYKGEMRWELFLVEKVGLKFDLIKEMNRK